MEHPLKYGFKEYLFNHGANKMKKGILLIIMALLLVGVVTAITSNVFVNYNMNENNITNVTLFEGDSYSLNSSVITDWSDVNPYLSNIQNADFECNINTYMTAFNASDESITCTGIANVYQPLEDQRLSTTDSPTFAGASLTAPMTIASNTATMLTLNQGDGGENQLVMQSVGANKWGLISNANDFFIYDYDGASDRFHIKDSGNVGIGTSSPIDTLTVGNGGSTDGLISVRSKNNNDNTGMNYYLQDGVSLRGFVRWDANEDLRLKGDEIHFDTGSTEVAKITSSGQFYANGNNEGDSVYINRDKTTTETMRMWTEDSGSFIRTIQDETGSGSEGSLKIQIDNDASNANFLIETDAGFDMMVVEQNGNTSIAGSLNLDTGGSVNMGSGVCMFYNGTDIVINNNAAGVVCP